MQMRLSSLMLCLAVLAVLAFAAPAGADLPRLRYGHAYHFQNGFNSYTGGYLETKGTGCGSAARCVSTNMNQVQGGAAAWTVLSASGKAADAQVLSGDLVILVNLADPNAGYLGTLGDGCQGGLRCVSTASAQANNATVWKIVDDSGDTNALIEGQPVHLQNGYHSFAGGYLNTNGTGCNGDYRCAGTQATWSHSDQAATWSPLPATDATSASGWCIGTSALGATNTVTLLDNGTSRLEWDAWGNLTLTNYAAAGLTSEGEKATPTYQSWGIGAIVPLTGSWNSKLCFDTSGALTITDYQGHKAWTSGPTGAHAQLSLTDCGLQIEADDASGAATTAWTQATAQCAQRSRPNKAPMSAFSLDQCWQNSSTPTRLLWDNETHLELSWANGVVSLQDVSQGQLWWKSAEWMNQNYNPASADHVCLLGGGGLAIFDGSNHTLWSMGTQSSSDPITLVLGLTGFGFNNATQQYAYRDEWFLNMSGTAIAWPRARVSNLAPGWCIGRDAPQDLLTMPHTATVSWSQGGIMVSTIPQTCNASGDCATWRSPHGDSLCFQSDGNLVIYDANHAPVWSSGTYGPTGGQNRLVLEGTDLAIVDSTKANICNQYFLHCSAGAEDPDCPTWKSHKTDCGLTSYFTLWTPNQQADVSSFTAGGFSFVKDSHMGNGSFGIEPWILASAVNANSVSALQSTVAGSSVLSNEVAALLPSNVPSDYTAVLGDLGLQATIFGHTPDRPVFDCNATVTNTGGNLVAHVEIDTVLGTLVSYSFDSSNVGIAFKKDLPTPLKAKATFSVGVPVTVEASIGESVGVNFTPTYTVASHTFELVAAPNVSAEVNASAGIGVAEASAGIYGTLTLAELAVPLDLTLVNGSTHTYAVTGTLEGTLLAGEMGLYAKAGPLQVTYELAGWDGITHNVHLFSKNGGF